jgi:hypothetical protein
MPRYPIALTAAVAGLTIPVAAARAQNTANVDVTVVPSYQPGQTPPPREGFLVCVGTSADRDLYGSQLTPTNGVANTAFRNLPTGQQVIATISKSGFAGMERTITLAADWNNHIQFHIQPGSGGPTCPTGSGGGAPSPTPPPVPAPPPPVGTKSLVITVLRQSNRNPVARAQVCVGSHASTSNYAGIQRTTSTGRAWFTVPAHYSVWATASASQLRGGAQSILLPRELATVSATILLPEGEGGPVCPGAAIDPAPAPPAPPPVSATFTLTVQVRRSTGTYLPDATVCVGSSDQQPASYGTQETSGTIGNTFQLPRATSYRVTVHRAAYGATAVTYAVGEFSNSGTLNVTLPANGQTQPRCT